MDSEEKTTGFLLCVGSPEIHGTYTLWFDGDAGMIWQKHVNLSWVAPIGENPLQEMVVSRQGSGVDEKMWQWRAGFPWRLENESNHGKVMEHEKLAKSHGILWSVMAFYQFCLWIVPNFNFSGTTNKLSSDLESAHFPMFPAKRRKCQIRQRNSHGNSRNGQATLK